MGAKEDSNGIVTTRGKWTRRWISIRRKLVVFKEIFEKKGVFRPRIPM